LEELRILYSSDMNMRPVELLLARCGNLRVLSELESWQDDAETPARPDSPDAEP
jgi:hypothetical protein